MTKPVIINRVGKAVPLTFAEHDTNFANLRNATVALQAGSGGTTVISDLNGVITLVAGTGIVLSGDNTAKTVTVSTTESQNIFQNIAVAGQTTVSADTATDTVTFAAGTNITITTNDATDTVTFNSTGGDVITDLTPQLGGNLDVNGFSLTSVANGDVILDPNGAGRVLLQATTTIISAGTSAGLITTPGVGSILIRPNSNTGAQISVSGSTTVGSVSLTPTGTGQVLISGPLGIFATGGAPTVYENGYYEDMLVVPVSWLRIAVGGTDYYLPLYQ